MMSATNQLQWFHLDASFYNQSIQYYCAFTFHYLPSNIIGLRASTEG